MTYSIHIPNDNAGQYPTLNRPNRHLYVIWRIFMSAMIKSEIIHFMIHITRMLDIAHCNGLYIPEGTYVLHI